jgi:hypothetical protein
MALQALMEPDYFTKIFTPLQANRSCAVLLADYQGKTAYWTQVNKNWFDDDYGCRTKYSGTICQRDSKILMNFTKDNDTGELGLQNEEGNSHIFSKILIFFQ